MADRPTYGRVSNLEPLYSCLREGRLGETTMQQLASSLGKEQDKGQELAPLVRQAVEDWKEREGAAATLAAFTLLLQRPQVGLEAVEREIRQNEENSRCLVPGLLPPVLS